MAPTYCRTAFVCRHEGGCKHKSEEKAVKCVGRTISSARIASVCCKFPIRAQAPRRQCLHPCLPVSIYKRWPIHAHDKRYRRNTTERSRTQWNIVEHSRTQMNRDSCCLQTVRVSVRTAVEPPNTSTLCPACNWPHTLTSWCAVVPTKGNAAATSNGTASGFLLSLASGILMNSVLTDDVECV
jgi:hypothetical protein